MDLIAVEAVLSGPAVLAPDSWREGDSFLAGGTWLFSEPQQGVRRLRDLTTLGWPALSLTEDALVVSATCTLAELAAYRTPASWIAAPLIGQCCTALLGSFKVWNVATVGGNLCLSLPAAPMTSLAVALDAELVLWWAGEVSRTVPAAGFVTGVRRNILRPGELLREIRLPLATLAQRTAFRSFSLSTGGRSAGVVTGRVAQARGDTVLTVTASTVRPLVLRFTEPPGERQVVQALASAAPHWTDDVHGLPQWRQAMTVQCLEQVRRELAP